MKFVLVEKHHKVEDFLLKAGSMFDEADWLTLKKSVAFQVCPVFTDLSLGMSGDSWCSYSYLEVFRRLGRSMEFL